MSTWAASGASVAGLALLGQPKVLVGQRLVDLSVLTLALCSAGGLAAVVSDARAWRMLAAPTAARADVGLGEDIVEEHVPGATPFRSVDRIEVIRVGSRPAGRRALGTLLALDAATLLFCAAALVARLVR
jgi:hypothetical protein